jgi:hypothetical protein
MVYNIGDTRTINARPAICVSSNTKGRFYRSGAYWVYTDTDTYVAPALSDIHHEYFQKLGESANVSEEACIGKGGTWYDGSCHFGGLEQVFYVYSDFYPGGYTDCVRDQECRGNSDPKGACALLMGGDPSKIKLEAGMGRSVLSDLVGGHDCHSVFTNTRLGPKMQATHVTGPVIVAAIKGDKRDEATGGTKVIDPKSQLVQIPEYVKDIVPDWEWPEMPGLPGIGWMKYLIPIIVILVIAVVLMVALGYSGLGPAAGSHMMKK